MEPGARKALLKQFCEDLSGKSEPQIAYACKRWRTEEHPRRFPTSGELLALMKNPYADPPPRLGDKYDGGCLCSNCRNKTPRDGFYKAPGSAYVRDIEAHAELNEWMHQRIEQVR